MGQTTLLNFSTHEKLFFFLQIWLALPLVFKNEYFGVLLPGMPKNNYRKPKGSKNKLKGAKLYTKGAKNFTFAPEWQTTALLSANLKLDSSTNPT